jgi:hypothetical protein
VRGRFVAVFAMAMSVARIRRIMNVVGTAHSGGADHPLPDVESVGT